MSTILSKIENNIGFINLNRPDAFNSFNREMALLLQQTLDDFSTNTAVRAIVITGNGKAFCAGQDLKEVISPELNPGFRAILEEHYNPIITRIRTIEKPILAAVLTASLLSMAGIPIFSGFFAKFVLFSQTIEAGYLVVVIAAVINSIISVGYYFKLILAMYTKESNEAPKKTPFLYYVVGMIAIALNVVMGMFPSLVIDLLR